MTSFDISIDRWRDVWEPTVTQWVTDQMRNADPGHDFQHVQRVVHNAIYLGRLENANADVFLPAAWLHDCFHVPKNSPQRSQASTLAAESAEQFLISIEYPSEWIDPITHCIRSHSFSARIPCETLEARIVQDADRLEAVGAIGLARCLMTGGSMGQRLYHPDEPFPINRVPEDSKQSVDHFFAKLLTLHATMQTESGRQLASERTKILKDFLIQLANEIGVPFKSIESPAISSPSPRFGLREASDS